MNNPGVYSLATVTVTTAIASPAGKQTAIVNLAGMTAVSLEFDFTYGTGSGTVVAVVRTPLDGGTKYRDIARADFANASAVKHCNLEGLLSKGITAYAALAAEGVYDGVLGDSLICEITSTGTYANSLIAVRASVR
jgi:hypothetical protein